MLDFDVSFDFLCNPKARLYFKSDMVHLSKEFKNECLNLLEGSKGYCQLVKRGKCVIKGQL
jgi:hypothetical protein